MDGALRLPGSACFLSHSLLVNGLIAVEEFQVVLVALLFISGYVMMLIVAAFLSVGLTQLHCCST